MKNLSKQFAGLATRLRDKVVLNIFTSARLRIALLYFFTGALILFVSGTLTYNRTIDILNLFTARLSGAISESLTKIPLPHSTTTVAQITQADVNKREQNSAVITDTVESEIRQMIYTASIWIVLAMLISAYVLSGITLKPIERALDNKKRFIANVSHELRTPLSVMKTSAETALLDKENTTKEELIAVLESNIEEVNRMSKILQLLFTFSNFEHRVKNLEMSAVDLSEIIEKSIQTLRIPIQKKNIHLEVWKDQGVFVQGNAVALEEVILNLLKNAIRHTPEKGLIRVVLEKKLYGIVMTTIKDSGSGISPKDLDNIFEPFYRGGKNVDSKAHAGLGLAIVKEIITMHHGTVSFESNVGEGTVVEIRLPGAPETSVT